MKRALFLVLLLSALTFSSSVVPAVNGDEQSSENETSKIVTVIQREDGSLEVTIAKMVDGNNVEQTVTAASEEELSEKYPDIYIKYAKYVLQQERDKTREISQIMQNVQKQLDPQIAKDLEPIKQKTEKLMRESEIVRGMIELQSQIEMAVQNNRDMQYILKCGDSEYDLTATYNRSVEPIGIKAENTSPALDAQLGIKGGVLITEVKDGGAGQKAGLKQYDVIVKVGEADVLDVETLIATLATTTSMQEATLKIIRQAQRQELNVRFVSTASESAKPSESAERP